MMIKKDVIEIAKGTAKFISAIGATIILHQMVKHVVPKDTSIAKKVAIFAGEYALGEILIDGACEAIEKSWTENAEFVKDIYDVGKKHLL